MDKSFNQSQQALDEVLAETVIQQFMDLGKKQQSVLSLKVSGQELKWILKKKWVEDHLW